jgi:hypothetical protein
MRGAVWSVTWRSGNIAKLKNGQPAPTEQEVPARLHPHNVRVLHVALGSRHNQVPIPASQRSVSLIGNLDKRYFRLRFR